MGGQHMADAVFIPVKRIIEVDDLSARVPEHSVAALLGKYFGDDFRTGQYHRITPFASL